MGNVCCQVGMCALCGFMCDSMCPQGWKLGGIGRGLALLSTPLLLVAGFGMCALSKYVIWGHTTLAGAVIFAVLQGLIILAIELPALLGSGLAAKACGACARCYQKAHWLHRSWLWRGLLYCPLGGVGLYYTAAVVEGTGKLVDKNLVPQSYWAGQLFAVLTLLAQIFTIIAAFMCFGAMFRKELAPGNIPEPTAKPAPDLPTPPGATAPPAAAYVPPASGSPKQDTTGPRSSYGTVTTDTRSPSAAQAAVPQAAPAPAAGRPDFQGGGLFNAGTGPKRYAAGPAEPDNPFANL